ncbi:MAG: phytoene desaturase family protein, partial [Sandaracinobacteroides sp.]
GFALDHHNVFFGEDYADEFSSLFERRAVSLRPTVYICAQDRGAGAPPSGVRERLLLLVNAPADGDSPGTGADAHGDVPARVRSLLADCGVGVELGAASSVMTGPAEFDALFPGSGGALYGKANHGMLGSFARPGSKSAIPGLFLAGGSEHPGAGVPMATLSGRLAAERIATELGLPSSRASR